MHCDNIGVTFHTDKMYASPSLVCELDYGYGIGCTGTLRSDRLFIPDCIKNTDISKFEYDSVNVADSVGQTPKLPVFAPIGFGPFLAYKTL